MVKNGESIGNPHNNNNARVGPRVVFICQTCHNPFATSLELWAYKIAHLTIPVSLICCGHGHECLIGRVYDHDHDHDDYDYEEEVEEEEVEEQRPALVTLDLLREWALIYATREEAQVAAGEEAGPTVKVKVEEEAEHGLDLELRL